MAVLGRNGMGKTTLLNSIVGVTRRMAGSLHLGGQDITKLRPEQRARAGIGWVPQERNIFRSLTVEENLTAVERPGKWTVARVYDMFPRLAERRRNMGNQLSGGEQQMLAVGRALVLNPRLLLLDEPTEGIQPSIIKDIGRVIRRLADRKTMAIVLVEQFYDFAADLADRYVVMERGAVVARGAGASMASDGVRAWMSV